MEWISQHVNLIIEVFGAVTGLLYLHFSIRQNIWLWPQWLGSELKRMDIDLFLLGNTDISWEPDPLRENPGEKQEYLLERYKKMILTPGYPLRIISGMGIIRKLRAVEEINAHFNDCLPVSNE